MAKPEKKKASSTRGSRRGVAIAVVAVVLAVTGGIYLWIRSSRQAAVYGQSTAQEASDTSVLSAKVVLPAIPRRPRPTTLPAEQFSDPSTRKSYEIARGNPELLEQMPCYCGCYANPGHTSNLDCFVDKHGET